MRHDFHHALIAGLATAALLLAAASGTRAEDRSLEETLNMLSGDAASEYMAPISSSIGADLNAGWFHRAPKADKLGLNLEISMVAMGSFFPEDADHFSVTGDFRFSTNEANMLVDYYEDEEDVSLPQSVRNALVEQITAEAYTVGISGATVVGAETDSVTIAYGGDTYTTSIGDIVIPAEEVKLPFGGFGDLADINVLPLAAPQLTVGTFYGTQVTLRYLPATELNSDLGELKYLGFGIQHNPAVWLKHELPVDLAVSFFTQNMTIGELFESKTTAFGVNASKTLGWRFLNLTPYAGFMIEDATMNVSYDFNVVLPDGTVETTPVSVDLESENTTRLTLGTNVRVGIVNWNVDYNIAAYPSISTGVTIAF